MIKRNRVPKSMWTNPVHFLAFGLGSGAAPFAPGTFGTLTAIPLYLLLVNYTSWPVYAVIVAIMFLVGVWMCDRTERDIGIHDHSGIVWDEFVGYLITMFFAPAGWVWVVAGFFLFRLFDIWKPFPVRQVERKYQKGFGIMIDDVVAGIYAALALQALVYLSVVYDWQG